MRTRSRQLPPPPSSSEGARRSDATAPDHTSSGGSSAAPAGTIGGTMAPPPACFPPGALSTFLLTYTCYACIYFTRKPYSVVKMSVGADLGLGKPELGMIDTAFLATYAFGQFTLAPLGDAHGARPVLAACFAASAASMWLFAHASSLPLLLACMGINGLVQALGFPLCMKALTPWLPSELRGAAMGVWTTSQQVGSVLATVVVGYLASTRGWRAALEIPALVVAAAAAAIFLFLREKPDAHAMSPPPLGASSSAAAASVVPGRKARGKAGKEPSPGAGGRFWDAIGIPGLINLGVCYFFIKLARYTLMFWLPLYLGEEHGYSQADAAYVSTLFDAGGVAGSLACGFVSDRLLRGNRLLAVAPFCVATGVLLLVYPSVAPMGSLANCAMLFAVGFFIAGPDSVLGGAATADACERRGATHLLTTAGGISNGLGSLGSMVQGPVSSATIERFGWPGLFRLLGALALCGAFTLWSQVTSELTVYRASARARVSVKK